MLTMTSHAHVMCCKSVGTDLSMLDIDDFITEICQLKKEMAVLEAKLKTRGDQLNPEDVSKVLSSQSSVYVSDGSSTESLNPVWSSRDQSTQQPQKSRHAQDSELSLTLLCYTDTNPTDAHDTVRDSTHSLNHNESTVQTSTDSLNSVCNAEEQQILNTIPLTMCSVKLMDCRKLMEIKTEPIVKEEQIDEEDYESDDDFQYHDGDDDDFFPSDESSDSGCDGEMASTSKHHPCITRGKTFSSPRHLKSNEKEHTEQKIFPCTRCEMSFATLQERRRHSNVHRKKLQCDVCEKVFISSATLKGHMKTHSGEKPFKCSTCGLFFKTKGTLSGHERIHTGEKPYACPHCDERFSQKAYLKKHVYLHTNERPYQCSECGKGFRDTGCLRAHQKTHSEKLYKCTHCDKPFRYKCHLITHERVHTGERPYLCSHCGKGFSNSGGFKAHQRIHTGEKPYKCSVCGKSFVRRYHLVTHNRTHTGERPYECSQCDKTFTQRFLLRIHQKVHIGENPDTA